MAPSRLRNSSAAPSLFRGRFLSSYTLPRSLSRTLDVESPFKDLTGSFLRGNKFVEPVIGSDEIERPAVVTKMNLTLFADHRVFDGKVGGAFFSVLQSNLSDIRRLLL